MRDRICLSGNGDPYSWVWQLPIRGEEIISVASGSAEKIKLLIHGGKVLTDHSNNFHQPLLSTLPRVFHFECKRADFLLDSLTSEWGKCT